MKKLAQFLTQHWLLVITLATFAFLAPTMAIGSAQSVWFDEAYSIRLAQSSWSDLFHFTAIDAHPPLYYVLLKIWGGVGGFGDLWLRLFSALTASGAVFLMLFFAGKYFDRRVAILAAPLLAFAPFLLRYGFEIRMYALAGLITVASTLILMKLVKERRRRDWILYGVLVAIGMWTLNLMALVFMAHLIWLLVEYFNAKPRQKFWGEPWLKSYILAIILYLPWVWFAIQQYTHSASSGVESAFGATELLRVISFGFLYEPEFWLNKWQSMLLIVALVAAIVAIVKNWPRARTQKSFFCLLLLIFVAPLIIVAILGLITGRNFFIERYVAHFICAIYLLIALAAALFIAKNLNLKSATIYLVLLLTLIVGVGNLARIGNYNLQRMEHNQAREIVAKIGGCGGDQTIVVDDVQKYFEISHYLPNCENLYFVAPPDTDFSHGYAPVENSPARFRDQEIKTLKLIVVRVGDHLNYIIPNGYEQISGRQFDEVVLETYIFS